MAIHLTALHPSPVSALPRRGRKERHGFEAISTAIAVPEVDPGAFLPMEPIGMGQVALYGIHERDGATWARLSRPDNGQAFSVEDVLGFMRDGTLGDPAVLQELRAALRFTPLQAGRLSIDGSLTQEADMSLGDPAWHVDGAALGRVTREESERSAASLSSWIARNLAVAGDGVMVRTPVMLEVYDWHGRLNVYGITRLRLSPYKIDGLRADRARAFCTASGRPFDDDGMEEGLGLFERWSEGLNTDDDALMLAERLPALVFAHAEAATWVPRHGRRIRSPEDAAAALDALRPLWLRGSIGGFTPEDLPMVLQACRNAFTGLRDAGATVPLALESPGGIMEQARRWYVSRLEEIAPEDVEAIAMLA